MIDCDITTLAVSAIVNAANTSLLGGGGVDGVIHRAAGPELLTECRALNGCDVGKARLSKGYRLPADCIIHTVGPRYKDGLHNENMKLAACYLSCFALCREHQLDSIAFPAISTGVYDFPFDIATRIAVFQTKKWLLNEVWPKKVIFCCFGSGAADFYLQTIEAMKAE